MDMEPEELQFQCCHHNEGMYNESCKLLLILWHRLFGTIALAFGLSVVLTDLISTSIGSTSNLEPTPSASAAYNRIASEWDALTFYLLLVVVLSLIATAVAIYPLARTYDYSGSGEGGRMSSPTLLHALAAVPPVCRHLAMSKSFLRCFGAVALCYNVVAAMLILIAILLAGTGCAGMVVAVALLLLYLVGLVYVISGVVSVLEDAVNKQRWGMREKHWTALGLFLALQAAFLVVVVAFRRLMVRNGVGSRAGYSAAGYSLVVRSCYGVGIAAAVIAVVVLELVAYGVVFFVCKAYRCQENVDNSVNADHLEEY